MCVLVGVILCAWLRMCAAIHYIQTEVKSRWLKNILEIE